MGAEYRKLHELGKWLRWDKKRICAEFCLGNLFEKVVQAGLDINSGELSDSTTRFVVNI